MKDFISIPGYCINPAAVAFIKFNDDNVVQVHVAGSVLSFDGDAATSLRDYSGNLATKLPAPEKRAEYDADRAFDGKQADYDQTYVSKEATTAQAEYDAEHGKIQAEYSAAQAAQEKQSQAEYDARQAQANAAKPKKSVV